jgi:hypothetical protein
MLASYQMRYRRLICVPVTSFFALLLISEILAQSPTPTGIHTEIRQTYNFQPHTLTTAQINEKSVVLDQFWKTQNPTAMSTFLLLGRN